MSFFGVCRTKRIFSPIAYYNRALLGVFCVVRCCVALTVRCCFSVTTAAVLRAVGVLEGAKSKLYREGPVRVDLLTIRPCRASSYPSARALCLQDAATLAAAAAAAQATARNGGWNVPGSPRKPAPGEDKSAAGGGGAGGAPASSPLPRGVGTLQTSAMAGDATTRMDAGLPPKKSEAARLLDAQAAQQQRDKSRRCTCGPSDDDKPGETKDIFEDDDSVCVVS